MLSLLYTCITRFTFGLWSHRATALVTMVTSISILFSTAALTLMLCIMNGFEQETISQLHTINAPLVIRVPGEDIDIELFGTIVKEKIPEIIAWSPVQIEYGLIYHPNNPETILVANIRGIDPIRETEVKTITRAHITPHKKLSELVCNNTILIGEVLAAQLNIAVGDTAIVGYTTSVSSRKKTLALAECPVIIAGTLKTGIDDLDGSLVIADHNFVRQKFPHGIISHINIASNPDISPSKVILKIKNIFPELSILQWQDLYPALYSALQLERRVALILVFLLIVMSAMHIVSLMTILVMQKQSIIALIRASGGSQQQILLITMSVSMSIVSIALFFGLSLAYIGGLILKYLKPEITPALYTINYIPISLSWGPFIYVGGFTILFAIIVQYITLKYILSHSTGYLLRITR